MDLTGIITFLGSIAGVMILFTLVLGYGKKRFEEKEANKELSNVNYTRKYISKQMRRC